MNNVKKYALEGTRAYIDVGTDGKCGTFTVKNTAREAPNIGPSELTARFVCGESSRPRQAARPLKNEQ